MRKFAIFVRRIYKIVARFRNHATNIARNKRPCKHTENRRFINSFLNFEPLKCVRRVSGYLDEEIGENARDALRVRYYNTRDVLKCWEFQNLYVCYTVDEFLAFTYKKYTRFLTRRINKRYYFVNGDGDRKTDP